MMRSLVPCLMVLLVLAGCGRMSDLFSGPRHAGATPQAAAADPAATGTPLTATVSPPPAGASTVEEFDTTTAEDRQAALAAPATEATERRLGETVASLGDPADPGFWMVTPLVTVLTQGRVEYPQTGKSVQVELRPSGGDAGSGSQLSLPAFRLLGAPLTDLPVLVVYAP